jgi:RNA polymerase sigma-70 factor (ECF subfamily)
MNERPPVDSPLASDSLHAADSAREPRDTPAPRSLASQQDQQTLSQLKRGNWSAVEDLVRRYQDRLFTTILRMVGHPDDAADLVQETFVRAMQNIGTFEGKSSLYTWLFRIAINLSLSHRRAGKYRRTTSIHPDDSENVNRQAASLRLAQQTEPDPATDAETHMEHARLLEHLAALPADLRAIIILRDIEECDYDQIGAILDLPPGTVKSRLFRARAALRERCISASQEHKPTP